MENTINDYIKWLREEIKKEEVRCKTLDNGSTWINYDTLNYCLQKAETIKKNSEAFLYTAIDVQSTIECEKIFDKNGHARINNPHLDLIFEEGFKSGVNICRMEKIDINDKLNKK